MAHNPDATRSQYMSDAETILRRAEIRGAKAVIVLVMGEPAANGFALACDPSLIIEMRAALPGILSDLAVSIQRQNRARPETEPN